MSLVLAVAVPAAEAAESRPRVGLVLSGGGALGATHVGVLKVLEELKVPIDVIAGTSMGAVVGGLYAAGYRADELDTLINTIDWVDLFNDRPPRELRPFRRKTDDINYLVDFKLGMRDGAPALPLGFIQGQKLTLMLRSLTARVRGTSDFDRLPIPYRAVAADLETGEPFVLGGGDLATAMRASMSVPGAFPPVEYEGRLLVDGGIANNLPIDVARAMGAEILIVSEIHTVPKARDDIDSALAVLNQVVSLTIRRTELAQLDQLEKLVQRGAVEAIVIKSDLGERTSVDFPDMPAMVAPGATAARAQAPALIALAQRAAASGDPSLRPRYLPPPAEPVLDFVDIVNKSPLGESVIRARIRVRPGERLDVEKLEAGIAALYASGDFERIEYRVVERDGQTGLEVTVLGKTWARNYFEFGVTLETDFGGEAEFNLATTFTMTGLNELGGEWRTGAQIGERPAIFTEFYQPLDPERQYFVLPRLSYVKADVLAPGAGGSLAVYRTSRALAELAGGVDLGTWGRVLAGTRHGFGDAELEIGTSPVKEFDFRTGQGFVQFAVDTLDKVSFPGEGAFGFVEFTDSYEALGATSEFRKVETNVNYAASWYRNTVVTGLRLGTSVEDNLPVEERFTLGGFLNLSGLLSDQLAGTSLTFGRLLYYRKLTSASPELFDLPVYAGASLEAGNVWQQQSDVRFGGLRYAGSVFMGADTPIGPAYLAYGRTDEGDNSFYLFLGQSF